LDEGDQWNFLTSINQKEISKIQWKLNDVKKRIEKHKRAIAQAKTKRKDLQKDIPLLQGYIRSEERLLDAYVFQLKKYREGFAQFKIQKKKESGVLNSEIAKLRKESGQFLQAHLKGMKKELHRALDNNELLRFEIFSGSGENIRYRVSGGNTEKTKRIPSHIKPEKHVNWNFQGEFWEDEIGSYRSTLKNNCPKQPKYSDTAAR
jgi:chromosome segregation ATPase